MGEVHKIHARNFESVNSATMKLEDLTLRLSFLARLSPVSEDGLHVTGREFVATMEALAKDADTIANELADVL